MLSFLMQKGKGNMAKKIVHIDLNAFFAQCEENRDPSLKGKAVAVGGNGKRGVVSTASYVARKHGVHSGMSMQIARTLCKDLIIIPGDYQLYAQESSKFFGVLKIRFKNVEQASIDECYIDMTEYIDEDENEHDYLIDLQLFLYKMTGLKCSMGLGDNKFLAKMASDYKKPMGLTIIHQKDVPTILFPIPIENMFGIGKKTAPKLKKVGINTIGDLAMTESSEVKSILGNTFEYEKSHANGFGNDVVDASPFDPKSVGASRTFPDDTTDYEEIKSMIVKLSKQVSDEMKKYRKVSSTLSVTLRDANFVTHSKQIGLVKPTNSLDEISSTALIVFERFWNGEPIRLVGVAMQNTIDEGEGHEQLTIFSKVNLNNNQKDNKKDIDDLIKDINSIDPGFNMKKASDIKVTKEKGKPTYHPFRGVEE